MMKAAWSILLVAVAASAGAQDVDQFESFRRAAQLRLDPLLTHVFGNDSVLAQIDELPESKALRFDMDGDGAIDALAWREGTTRVAALDDDRDLRPDDLRCDRDSDCYLADIGSDGIVDRVVDYVDLDGDGDADRQDLYEITHGSLGTAGLGVTTVMDLDDDNRLFSLSDYSYHANRDQWTSDFDGNTCFVAGEWDESLGRWRSSMENPFCFYDDDGDGRTDEALRIEGNDLLVNSIRWSFDADGDATPDHPRDYDFSLTATGRVRAPEAMADSVVLRDGSALRFVSWAHARDLARWGLWSSVLLVWDEDDLNVGPFCETPDRERWEGVIADGFAGFAQIGGPSCGRINKRYEIDHDGSGRLCLYLSEIDDRLHLLGAEEGEFTIQIPASPPLRRVIRYSDGNDNGFFDRWSYLAETPTAEERVFEYADEAVRIIPLDGPSIRRAWRKVLPAARDRSRWNLEPFERSKTLSERGAVRRWWFSARDRNDPLAVRAQRSGETDRFLYDVSLWDVGGGFLSRGTGNADPAMVIPIECPSSRGTAPPREPPGPDVTTRAGVPSSDTRSAFEHGWLVDVSTIAPDQRDRLLLHMIAELAHGDARIPGQLEEWDGDSTPDVLYFPPKPERSGSPNSPERGAPRAEPETLAIQIDPASPLPRVESVRVDPYLPSGIGFESRSIAYRLARNGLDAYVKKGSGGLVLRMDLGGPGNSLPWELDPLGAATSEFAGLYVSTGDAGWRPLFTEDATRSERVIASGPFRTVVQAVSASGGLTATRTWTLGEGDRAVLESLQIERSGADSTTIAFVIPAEGARAGMFEGFPGLWSYLPSRRSSEPVAFAGALLDGRPARAAARLEGALQFTIVKDEPALLGWVVGGGAHGDSTAEAWVQRAAGLLRARRDRDVLCVPR